MSRILLVGSTLTLGAGAGVGGLVVNTLKSESQADYKTVFLNNNSGEEGGFFDDVLERPLEEGFQNEELENSSEGSRSSPEEEPGFQVQQREGDSEPVRPKEWHEKCTFYKVKSSTAKTAIQTDYDFVKVNVKNKQALQGVEKDCRESYKVYISNPSSSGGTYRGSDQKIQGNIVSS